MTCKDIDECKGGTAKCHKNAVCNNTDGGFECNCNDGFSGDGSSCSDVDECDDGSNDCDENATCVNNVGGFSCKCGSSANNFKDFHGDGNTCENSNECKAKTHTCHRQASCRDTVGGFECSCNDGFSGDGFACVKMTTTTQATTTTPPPACKSSKTNNCHRQAKCTNHEDGSFSCECKGLLEGDGVTCSKPTTTKKPVTTTPTKATTQAGACKARSTNNCHNKATCTDNDDGTFTCTCKGGLVGDGITCKKAKKTTTKNPATSGRPQTTDGGVKGAASNLKQANVQAHMQNFSSLKDKMFQAVNRVMAGRTGKTAVWTARMKGIGRKALSRRRRKCPLDLDHKQDAANALDNAQSIEDVRAALIQVLVDRTSEIPPCKNIRKMIGRKVTKIATRMNGQSSA